MRVLSATLLTIGRPSVRSNPMYRKLTGRTFAGKNDKTGGLIKTEYNKKKKLSKFEFPVQIQNNELIGYRVTGSPRTSVQSKLFPEK